MADNSFEIKFAQLADARLQEIAPSIYDRRVGFQLIEQEDDGTKGIGVIALMINNTWIYIPSFFLKGVIKLPAMYIKRYDTCVPLNDSWVSFIKSNELETLGVIIEKDHRLNDRMRTDQQTNILELSNKISNESDSVINNQEINDIFNIKPYQNYNMLQKLSKEDFITLTKTMKSNPEFGNSIFEHYTPQQFYKRASEVDQEVVPNKPLLRKITLDKIASEDLSDEEKTEVYTAGKIYKDDRPKHSVVYADRISRMALSNPNERGLYKVLQEDGGFKDLFILCPHTNATIRGGETRRIAVVDPKSPTKFTMVDRSLVLAKQEYVEKHLSITVGKSADGLTRKKMYDLYDRSLLLVDKKGTSRLINTYDLGVDKDLIKFTDKDGLLTKRNGIIYIPKQTVYFTEEYDDNKLALGNLNLFTTGLVKQSKLIKLKVYSDRDGYTISSDIKQDNTLRKYAALELLMSDYGMREDTATNILNENEVINSGSKSSRYLVKHSGIQDPGTELGSISVLKGEDAKQTTDMLPDAINSVVNASETGMKDVIDVSVLSSLANTSQALSKVGEYIPELIKAMDRVGKILFLFYWNTESFKEQYGAMELGDLEAKLTEVFTNVGDLVMFLKEKNSNASSLFDGNQDSISDDLGDID